MLDLAREIMQTLRNNKLRTSLTGFAVAWGIFMLIILLGMSNGMLNSFNDNVQANGDAAIKVYNGYTSLPYKGLKENRFIRMRESDMATVKKENSEHISDVSSQIEVDTATISTTYDYLKGGFTGVFPNFIASNGFKVTKGRFINQKDMDERRKVMVITQKNAEILFEDPETAVGSQVKSMGLAFTIVGIYDRQGWNSTFVPFTTVEALIDNGKRINSMTVTIKGLETVEQGEQLEKDIRGTLSRLHTFDPEDQSAVWVWNQFTNRLTTNKALNILNIAIWIIGIFTMLSGIVGVSNIMFVSVRERTHEIGIRRAIGAKPRNILTQIILESVSITALFGYIGIFLGTCVTEIIAVIVAQTDSFANPSVDIEIALEVTLVLIIAGALAGLFPALKALKIRPVEALRTE